MSELQADASFELAGPDIIWEAFEDEVVVVNLDSGCYYALDPVGGAIFDMLATGIAIPEIVGAIAARYEGERDAMGTEIAAFTQKLRDAALLRERSNDAPVEYEANDAPAEKSPFQPPQLRVFTDMQDLLLIDPIHEVDEMGWPVRQDPGGE